MNDAERKLLPEAWRAHVPDNAEELRFRVGYPPTARTADGVIPLASAAVTSQQLDGILQAATGRSPYLLAQSAAHGYFTLPGGDRIGICGTYIRSEQGLVSLHALSSLCIRVAREIPDIGVLLHSSTLILGPPGSGKTTLLRGCIRMLSDRAGKRVSVADERGEIAACVQGKATFPLGENTDILTDCPKAAAMPILVRTMAPEWLAVDEITCREDVLSVAQMGGCGVRIIATAHAESAEDLHRRPIYRMLTAQRIFEDALILGRDHTYRRERLL